MADSETERRASRWQGGRYLERGDVLLHKNAKKFESWDFLVYVLIYLIPPLMYTSIAKSTHYPLVSRPAKIPRFVRKQLVYTTASIFAMFFFCIGDAQATDLFEIFGPAVLLVFRALTLAWMAALCGINSPSPPLGSVTLVNHTSDGAGITTAVGLVRFIHNTVIDRYFNKSSRKLLMYSYRVIGLVASILLCAIPVFGRYHPVNSIATTLFGRTWADACIFICFAVACGAFGQWFFAFLCNLSKFFRYTQYCLLSLASGAVGSRTVLRPEDPDEQAQEKQRDFALDITNPLNLKSWLDIRRYYQAQAQVHFTNHGLRLLCLLLAASAIFLLGITLAIINKHERSFEHLEQCPAETTSVAFAQFFVPTSLQGYLNVIFSTHTAILCVELCSIFVGLAAGQLLFLGAAVNNLLTNNMTGKLHQIYIQSELDFALGVAILGSKKAHKDTEPLSSSSSSSPNLTLSREDYQLQLEAATRLLPLMKENLGGSTLGLFGYSFDAILTMVKTVVAPTLLKLVLEIFS